MRQRLISYIDPSLISLPEGADCRGADDYSLEPLKTDIMKNGIVTPLVVRKNGAGRPELVCGKRRLLCARLLRMRAVPCVKIKCDDARAALLRFSCRVSALPPDPYETAQTLSDLTARGLTAAQAAEYLCADEAKVMELLKLLRLPAAVRRKAARGGLPPEHALLLLKLPPDEREAALDEILKTDPGRAAIEEIINSRLTPARKEPEIKAAISDIRLFSNSVEKLLFTLSRAGFETEFSATDEPAYINYTVRIKKKPEAREYSQMKIC